MLIGMDVGGTNTDLAMVEGDISSEKISNARGLREALARIRAHGRLAVSTSTPLNHMLTGSPLKVYTLLIPGPGLFWPGAVSGAVNHRGDIVESLDPVEIDEALTASQGDALAIAGKFSVRNPAVEEEAASRALRFFSRERIAVSHHLAQLDFPGRVATTRLNAVMKETVISLAGDIRKEKSDFLFFKGDGGLTLPEYAIENPSLLAHSSAAAVAIGAYFLSGVDECMVVDVGGTTTDLVPLEGGKPIMEGILHEGERTVTTAVSAMSLPFGGDSHICEVLEPRRLGDALAFGGSNPTLTDALNRTGEEIGDFKASGILPHDLASQALEEYYTCASRVISASGAGVLVGTGFLAPYLIPEIARRTGTRFTIPPHHECANAVGVAVSRFSLTLHARFDSARTWAMFNGERQEIDTMGDDEAILEKCREEVRRRALAAGADPRDVGDIDVLHFHSYDVIRGSYRNARIADVVVQIAPGITVEAQ